MECTVLIQLFYIYPGSFESICQSCQYEAELCPENVMYSDFYFFTPGYKHTYYHMCKNLTSLKSGLSEGLDLKSKMLAFKMHAPCGHHILTYMYEEITGFNVEYPSCPQALTCTWMHILYSSTTPDLCERICFHAWFSLRTIR